MSKARAFVFGFALAALSPGVGVAAPADELRAVETQISREQERQDKLDAAAQETARALTPIRERLIEATRGLQEKQTEESVLEDKLDALSEQIAAKSDKARAERAQLIGIISTLVQVASRPPETLFLQHEPGVDHVHRTILLRAVLPELKARAQGAARDLSALYDMKTQLAEQKRLVAAAQENLGKQRRALDQLVAARQGQLQRTEAQKAEIDKKLAALTDEAKDLRQLMQRLAPKKPPAAKPAPKDGVNLKWPVAGQVKRKFGDRDADGVVSEGVAVAGPSGAPVIAPLAGRVAFAGPFRGYGQIMILAHANGFHSFLSGFGRIDAYVGQDVAAGEPLGVLPSGSKRGEKPELYFEWRRGDDPMDPMGRLPAASF